MLDCVEMGACATEEEEESDDDDRRLLGQQPDGGEVKGWFGENAKVVEARRLQKSWRATMKLSLIQAHKTALDALRIAYEEDASSNSNAEITMLLGRRKTCGLVRPASSSRQSATARSGPRGLFFQSVWR